MTDGKIVFIVGNGRSGTTMLGRVFGRHARVHTFGELHFFEQWAGGTELRTRPAWTRAKRVALLERLLTTEHEGFFRNVTPGRYQEAVERILVAAGADDAVSVYAAFLHDVVRGKGRSIPCEQTPRYLYFTKEILELFPDARIINMVRDPRDVMLSQKNKWRRRFLGGRTIPFREAFRSWINYHPYTIAKLWVSAVREARHFEGEARFRTMRFEDLVAHPEESVRSLCEFAGISFEPAMLAVPQVGSSVGTDRPDRLGIDAGRAGSWRKGGLSDLELAFCERVAGEEMKRLGYVPGSGNVSAARRIASMAVFAVKAVLALMMNLRRTRNLRETLRRRMGRGGSAA